jgi:two-component system cell cycle sensor histidine kinase/response regulator CckA
MNNPSHPAVDRPGKTVSATAPVERAAGGRVLVIDDDDAVGLVLSRAMARLGYQADVAADGPKGVSAFEANPEEYGLVLLDFKLPGMDSGTVYRKLRERSPRIPVVLMSGYNKQEALDSSEGMELAGFLHKPFNMETLTQALRFAQPD